MLTEEIDETESEYDSLMNQSQTFIKEKQKHHLQMQKDRLNQKIFQVYYSHHIYPSYYPHYYYSQVIYEIKSQELKLNQQLDSQSPLRHSNSISQTSDPRANESLISKHQHSTFQNTLLQLFEKYQQQIMEADNEVQLNNIQQKILKYEIQIIKKENKEGVREELKEIYEECSKEFSDLLNKNWKQQVQQIKAIQENMAKRVTRMNNEKFKNRSIYIERVDELESIKRTLNKMADQKEQQLFQLQSDGKQNIELNNLQIGNIQEDNRRLRNAFKEEHEKTVKLDHDIQGLTNKQQQLQNKLQSVMKKRRLLIMDIRNHEQKEKNQSDQSKIVEMRYELKIQENRVQMVQLDQILAELKGQAEQAKQQKLWLQKNIKSSSQQVSEISVYQDQVIKQIQKSQQELKVQQQRKQVELKKDIKDSKQVNGLYKFIYDNQEFNRRLEKKYIGMIGEKMVIEKSEELGTEIEELQEKLREQKSISDGLKKKVKDNRQKIKVGGIRNIWNSLNMKLNLDIQQYQQNMEAFKKVIQDEKDKDQRFEQSQLQDQQYKDHQYEDWKITVEKMKLINEDYKEKQKVLEKALKKYQVQMQKQSELEKQLEDAKKPQKQQGKHFCRRQTCESNANANTSANKALSPKLNKRQTIQLGKNN